MQNMSLSNRGARGCCVKSSRTPTGFAKAAQKFSSKKWAIRLIFYSQRFTSVRLLWNYTICSRQQFHVHVRSMFSLWSTVIMASSLKLLQFFQKCHKIIGIYPSQPNQKHCSITTTNTIAVISFTQLMLTMAGFLVYETVFLFDYFRFN